MRSIRILTSALVLATSIPWLMPAQPVVSARAGLISYTEGGVYLDGHAVESTATHFPEVKETGVLRTEAGRAEVLLAPCAALRVGENSSFRLLVSAVAATRVELLSGSAIIDAGEMPHASRVTLLVSNTGVTFSRKGVYRFDFAPAVLRVFSGNATVERDQDRIPVGAGRMLALIEIAAPVKLPRGAADALDDWSRKRSAEQAKASGATGYQAQQAQALAAAATASASTEINAKSPEEWHGPPSKRSGSPTGTIFPNPARTGAYGLPGCVQPK